MKKLITFPIYFDDLTETAQFYLKDKFGKIPWEAFPFRFSAEIEIEEEKGGSAS